MTEERFTVKKLYLGRHKVAGGKPDWTGAGFAVANGRGEIMTTPIEFEVARPPYAVNVFETKQAAQAECDWMNENL